MIFLILQQLLMRLGTILACVTTLLLTVLAPSVAPPLALILERIAAGSSCLHRALLAALRADFRHAVMWMSKGNEQYWARTPVWPHPQFCVRMETPPFAETVSLKEMRPVTVVRMTTAPLPQLLSLILAVGLAPAKSQAMLSAVSQTSAARIQAPRKHLNASSRLFLMVLSAAQLEIAPQPVRHVIQRSCVMERRSFVQRTILEEMVQIVPMIPLEKLLHGFKTTGGAWSLAL